MDQKKEKPVPTTRAKKGEKKTCGDGQAVSIKLAPLLRCHASQATKTAYVCQ
jgi:hypothetical protein